MNALYAAATTTFLGRCWRWSGGVRTDRPAHARRLVRSALGPAGPRHLSRDAAPVRIAATLIATTRRAWAGFSSRNDAGAMAFLILRMTVRSSPPTYLGAVFCRPLFVLSYRIGKNAGLTPLFGRAIRAAPHLAPAQPRRLLVVSLRVV